MHRKRERDAERERGRVSLNKHGELTLATARRTANMQTGCSNWRPCSNSSRKAEAEAEAEAVHVNVIIVIM